MAIVFLLLATSIGLGSCSVQKDGVSKIPDSVYRTGSMQEVGSWNVEKKGAETDSQESGSAEFGAARIDEILKKIDAESKDQIVKEALSRMEERVSTWVFVQEGFRAEFADGRIETTVDGKSHGFQPLNGSFLGFFGFSPSGRYLYYITNDGWENGPAVYYRIVDSSSGKPVLTLGGYEESAGIFAWTPDRKRFIYSRQTLSRNTIEATVKWKFPETIDVDTRDYRARDGYADGKYLYTRWEKGVGKYLKIYDLDTLKEAFSKEIEK